MVFAAFNKPTKYFNITLISLLMLHLNFDISAGCCCNSCKGGNNGNTNKTSTKVNPPKKSTHGNPPKKTITKNSTDNKDSGNEANEKMFKNAPLLWIYKRKLQALQLEDREEKLKITEEDIRNATEEKDMEEMLKTLNSIEIHIAPFEHVTLDPDNINLDEEYLYIGQKDIKNMKFMEFIMLINNNKAVSEQAEAKRIFGKLMEEGKLFNLLKLTPNTIDELYDYENEVYNLYVDKDTLTLKNYIKLGEFEVSDIRKNIDIYTDSYILFSKSDLEDEDVVTVFKKPITIDLDELTTYKNIVFYDNEDTEENIYQILFGYYSSHGGEGDMKRSGEKANDTFSSWLYDNRGKVSYGRCESINHKGKNLYMVIILPPCDDFIKLTKIKGYKKISEYSDEYKIASKDEMVKIGIVRQGGLWSFYYIKE